MTKEEFKKWAEKSGWICWGKHRGAGVKDELLDELIRRDEVWMTPEGRVAITTWYGSEEEPPEYYDVEILEEGESPATYVQR